MLDFLKKNKIDLGIVFIFPMICGILVEIVYRGNIEEFLLWGKDFPIEVLFSYLLYFSLINVFIIFSRKTYLTAGTVSMLLLLMLVYVSNIKEFYRGEPIQPWDLKLEKEALGVSTYFFESLSFGMVALLVMICLVIITLLCFSNNKKYHIRSSVFSVILCVLMISLLYIDKPFPIKETMGIEYINWSQEQHYNQNGFAFGFLQSLSKMIIEEPENYTQEKIESILMDIEEQDKASDEFKPNIIFIMSEAFWDPTVLDGVEFDKDPIPFFHKIQKENINGTLLTHIYGGGTVNTEFEALTGFTTQFLPVGSIPYTNYLNEPTHSVAWLLKEQGYAANAIHSYSNWFYRRDDVYKLLGFDSFTPFEFYVNATKNGEFIRDIHMTENIVEKIKQTDEKDFIHAVSMEAHGPYPSVYEEDKLISVTGEISDSSKEILESYASKINGADKALENLVNEIEKLNEPTIILFFGDHLPALGANYQVYNETNYFQDEYTYEDYLKMYSLPFIVWDNFSNKSEELRMTPNFLAPYVLDLAKRDKSIFFNLVQQVYESGTEVIPKNNYFIEENIDEKDLKDYKLLQYDMMLGKKFYHDDSFTMDLNESYSVKGIFETEVLSSYDMMRKDISFNPREGNSRLEIKIQNLPEMLAVYEGETELTTIRLSDNEINVLIPDDLKKGKEQLNINFRVMDVNSAILEELDELIIPLVDDNKFISRQKNEMENIVIDGTREWETFLTNDEYSILRTNFNLLSSTNYMLFIDEKEFIPSNADEMDRAYLSDIYEDGYLYISILTSELQSGINAYFNENPLTLYYKK